MRTVKHRRALAAAVSLGLLAGCSGPDPTSSETPTSPEPSTSQPDDSTSATPDPTPQPEESASDSADGDVVANPPSKNMQDALTAAQDEFSGDVSKIELETQQAGGLEYKIELVSADTEYAVQFDADSLEKLSEKRDDLGDDAEEDHKKTFDPASLISLEEAASTAREQQDGVITKWKIEGKDSGVVQYEFDIQPDGASGDTEVQINAKDGSVIQDS